MYTDLCFREHVRCPSTALRFSRHPRSVCLSPRFTDTSWLNSPLTVSPGLQPVATAIPCRTLSPLILETISSVTFDSNLPNLPLRTSPVARIVGVVVILTGSVGCPNSFLNGVYLVFICLPDDRRAGPARADEPMSRGQRERKQEAISENADAGSASSEPTWAKVQPGAASAKATQFIRTGVQPPKEP